jgi:aspartyl-tRNA(Asn)/glutamyl-tRNA(Gln) amidotransferase subunit C
MSFTSKQIESIAQLARLELKESEVPVYAASLSSIIELVGQLDRADTTSVEPMAHAIAGQVQRLRADEPTSGNARDLFQRNAPQVDGGLYLVPRVIE